jgi:hypothetical protein
MYGLVMLKHIIIAIALKKLLETNINVLADEQIYHDSIRSCGSSNNKQLRDMFRSACKMNNIEITECSKFYDKNKILLTIKKAEESVKKEHGELSEKYSERLRIQSEINKRNEELKAKSEEIKNLINNK